MIKKIYAWTFLRFAKLFSRKNFEKYLGRAIDKHCKKKSSILNIGAGGAVKAFLMKYGLKFIEIDVDKKMKPDYVMSVEDMKKFKDNTFDVVFCLEVLEHVQNPFKGVEEIYRVLKKGGVLIGSTPFVFPIHEEPYDYYRYTKYGIQHMFKQFKQLELRERNRYMDSAFVLYMRLLSIGSMPQRLIGVLLLPLFIILLPFHWIIGLLVSNKQATTGYFYVYRK